MEAVVAAINKRSLVVMFFRVILVLLLSLTLLCAGVFLERFFSVSFLLPW
jgi:hypothetical protein